MLLTTLFFFACSVSTAFAGSLTKGQNCSVGENRLQVGSYAFYTMCDTHTFCNGTSGVCEAKGCRKDQYPYGYNNTLTDPPPPLCLKGQFCPDEEDACQPQMEVGSPCQLNRDDQCTPPPNYADLADRTPYGLNKNGSVCLNGQCMWANATLGTACTVENTPYIGYSADSEFIYIVSRHNCIVGTYCDSQNLVCVRNNLLGESCTADKECETYNCLDSGICGKGPQEPNHVPVYVYILVAIGILGGMIATLITLFIFHRRSRDAMREQRAQYFREQQAFRQDLDNMRQSARMSIMSMSSKGGANANGGSSNRSTMYSTKSGSDGDGADNASAGGSSPKSLTVPLISHGRGVPRASGLRQQLTGDTEDEDEEDETPSQEAGTSSSRELL